MTRRVKQRKLKEQAKTKSELRRIRRGRQPSSQSGQGHGTRTRESIIKPTRKERLKQEREVAKAAAGILERVLGK